ncbi:hypothetical protein DFJ74DRAFT_288215 [Hyaloraphidium curvatum]|nr:hypothetical protein DFJ74DRAFT_288215 [Hyaloraphidium curvatum]
MQPKGPYDEAGELPPPTYDAATAAQRAASAPPEAALPLTASQFPAAPPPQPAVFIGPPPAKKTHLAIFSGSLSRWAGKVIPKRFSAVTLCGGVEIDLRDGQLQPGETVIDAFSICGGVNVTARREVRVELDGGACCGGQADQRPPQKGEEMLLDRWVTIRGLSVCGGVSVSLANPGEEV